MYGGTIVKAAAEDMPSGLSPRVRGNLETLPDMSRSNRSIPACTGEPLLLPCSAFLSWVYPRVYGGTSCSYLPQLPASGLSPRVRGNLSHSNLTISTPRSIPACTGEPSIRRVLRSLAKVYPRVYGGTYCIYQLRNVGYGLSPRVRGNRI